MSWQSWLVAVLAPAAMVAAGCGGRVAASGAASVASLSIHAAVTHLDTGKTTRLTATLDTGEPAQVEWSVSGGDPHAGAGSISADGLYTPPSYLTRDAVAVRVSAVLAGRAGEPAEGLASAADTATLTVTPSFLQPLTPGNLAIGPGGSVTISGSMTEVGGSGGIRFHVASDAIGTPAANAGSLSEPSCVRQPVEGPNPAYTVCTVTYTAPAAVSGEASVFVVGSIPASGGNAGAGGVASGVTSWTRVLVNPAGILSNPAAHQARLAVPVALGSSSGSNVDYDANLGQLTDCCGGTLGALLQDAGGTQYVLSNNHVFARSDQSMPGETIIQPGLIDNGCTPFGVGPGTTPVATLSGYPPLASPATDVDAAIARVTPGLVDSKGSILELGARLADGTLGAAPPGISSTGGKGEAAALGMTVAKSGRTTGLTCAAVSAIDVDVTVDYFTDCAETAHSLSKTFTHQIALAGTSFSDAGDSGALVVDAANAEPVGLFFAGGTDANGVEQAIASPAGEVLAELNSQAAVGSPTSLTFVGGADHPVSCLNYDAEKAGSEARDGAPVSLAERERVEAALPLAQLRINPSAGILRVGVAASKDRPGAGAVAFYVDSAAQAQAAASIPAEVGGVPTVVLAANGAAAESASAALPAQPRAASLSLALAVKQRVAASLMKANPAIFGVGVGQSLNDAGDAAIVLYVDRNKLGAAAGNALPASIPEAIEGQRVRAIAMDRLHVTRSHGTPMRRSGCLARRTEEDLPLDDAWKLPE